MKVLLVCHRYPPRHTAGTEVYTAQLAAELRRRGHAPSVLTTEKDVSRPDLVLSEREHAGVRVFELVNNLFHEAFRSTWDQPEIDRQFGDLLDRLRPDVVHVQHLLYLSLGCVEEARRRGIQVVVTLHDFWLQCPRFGQRVHADGSLCATLELERCGGCLSSFKHAQTPLQRAAGRAVAGLRSATGFNATAGARRVERLLGLSRRSSRPVEDPARAHELAREVAARDARLRERVIPAVALFLAPSRFLRRSFETWGIPAQRLRHVPTGILGQRVAVGRRASAERLDIAFLGTLAPHKGAHVLLEAWGRVAPALRARARLDLWGPAGEDRDYARRLVRSASEVGAHLRGPLRHDRAALALERTDLLVVPSVWFENAPLVILEALAARTPVLVSDLGGAAEMVVEGENGFCFHVGDARDLARRLSALLADPEALARVAASPREPLRFSGTVDQTLAAYREALGHGSGERPLEVVGGGSGR